MLSWPMRGSRAEVTTPKLLLLKLPLGFLNCAWLKILKNSTRNSRAMVSVTSCSSKGEIRV